MLIKCLEVYLMCQYKLYEILINIKQTSLRYLIISLFNIFF